MNQTITYTHRGAGGTITKSITVSADAEGRQVIPFASDAADVHIDVFLPYGTIKAITILSDQDVKLEYNNNAGANGHIDLTAGIPVYWFDGAPWTYASVMGFAAGDVDITDFYLTNEGGSDAAAGTLSIIWLADPTP